MAGNCHNGSESVSPTPCGSNRVQDTNTVELRLRVALVAIVCHGFEPGMQRRATLFAILWGGLLVAFAFELWVGVGDLGDEALRTTLLRLRGARGGAAVLAGSALAAGGVIVQGLFRNPLASPSILGTTAGASLGGQLAIIAVTAVGWSWLDPELVLPLGCLLGALGSLAVLLLFLRLTDDLLALLLVGFILSSLFLSIAGFATSLAQQQWELGRAVVAFSLGSVAGTGVKQLAFAAPLIGIGLVACWGWGKPLDLLLSGEDEARSLGVDVSRVRWWTACWVSVLVGAAVSLGGSLAFVGLVIPHALRPFAGVAHRRLLWPAALAGGAFVVFCDAVARAIPSPTEVPLGVVTGLIGAPIFLVLLLKARRQESDRV